MSEIYQEGLFTKWREKREKKKAEKAQQMKDSIDALENEYGVKFSKEFRMYLSGERVNNDVDLVEIFRMKHKGLFKNKGVVFEFDEIMDEAMKYLKRTEVEGVEDASNLYAVGYYYLIKDEDDSDNIYIFCDENGTVYTALYERGFKAIKYAGDSIRQFLSSFYAKKIPVGDMKYTHHGAYAVNGSRFVMPKSVNVDVKIPETLSGGVSPRIFDLEYFMLHRFNSYVHYDVGNYVNAFLKRRVEAINALRDAITGLIEIIKNTPPTEDGSNDGNGDGGVAINGIKISFWEIFEISEREYVYDKSGGFKLLLHCTYIGGSKNVIDIHIDPEGRVRDVESVDDRLLTSLLTQFILYVIGESRRKSDSKFKFNEHIKEQYEPMDVPTYVGAIVNQSDNLITALEAVGAMYGIPAENFLTDDSSSHIRINEDMVIVPSNVKASGNTKSIMCTIGVVLDNISQRIDAKLTDYQKNNICDGVRAASRRTANPSKGEVVGRYEDDNHEEILVYNTGLVDMGNTPEALRKVRELRANGLIPEITTPTRSKPSYFTDEDDLASSVNISSDSSSTVSTNDISSSINESDIHIEMYEIYNGSTQMGYELLQEQGFDFVKSTMYQEGDSPKKSKKSVDVKPEDIKYMKFDNKNIIKAIKHFNKARENSSINQAGTKFSFENLINNEDYQKAIDCLNKQFNCRINIRFFKFDNNEENFFTSTWNDLKNNMTISKSKGFQLGGLPVDIFVINKVVDADAIKKPDMFGQYFCSILLHEIFHNIAKVIDSNALKHRALLSATLMSASNEPSARKRRIIITNYVNAVDKAEGGILNRFTRRSLIKQLTSVSALQHNVKALQELQSDIVDENNKASDAYIDKLIKAYEDVINKHQEMMDKREKRRKSKLHKVFRICSYIIGALIPGIGWLYALSVWASVTETDYDRAAKEYKNSKHLEEYYCDLFASMYKLPPMFLYGVGDNRVHKANDIDTEKLKKLIKLDIKLHELMLDEHPSGSERNYSGARIAKQLLEIDKDMEPDLKTYCQWIVDNFSSAGEMELDEIYNQTTFDPKLADDMDKHIQNLITNNDITLTESFKLWLSSDESIL
ncbi:MAG: hypothetical protein IKA36_02810 [Clostridia bacterium]|nr:hypothetical protein [Clostridia bacterium]